MQYVSQFKKIYCKRSSVGCLKLNHYPHGLGKGYDGVVVGTWLDEELGQVKLALIEAWPKTWGGSWARQSLGFIRMEKLELNNINNSKWHAHEDP